MSELTSGRVFGLTMGNTLAFIGGVIGVALAVYLVYMRYFHPLAKYPGPFLASLTNIWKAYTMFEGRMGYVITDLHDKYGAVVRIGPNELVFSHPTAMNKSTSRAVVFEGYPFSTNSDKILRWLHFIPTEYLRNTR
jgi:hypothetical protein